MKKKNQSPPTLPNIFVNPTGKIFLVNSKKFNLQDTLENISTTLKKPQLLFEIISTLQIQCTCRGECNDSNLNH